MAADGPDPAPDPTLFAAVFTESPIAVLRVARDPDGPGRVLDANPAAQALLGRGTSPVGRDLADLLGAPATGVGQPGLRLAVSQRSGPPRWVAAEVTDLTREAWPDGRPCALVILLDVTEAHLAQQRLDRAARQDPLTGLINRGELLRRLGAVDPARDGPTVAVMYLDLDGFKAVNDTRGHAVGDELLVAVARRIRGAVRPEDWLARIGGDEFVVVCPRLSAPRDARAVAERVRATLDEPVSVAGAAHQLSMSIGVAAAPCASLDPADLLRDADLAMYRAKRDGGDAVRLHRQP